MKASEASPTRPNAEVDILLALLELDGSFSIDNMTDSMAMGGIVDSMKINKTTGTAVTKTESNGAAEDSGNMKLKNAPQRPVNRKRSGLRRGYPDGNYKRKQDGQ